jgi:hypothetical protein
MTLPTTPSTDECRQEFATALQAAATAWAASPGGYPLAIEAENRTLVDLASPQAERPFLAWELRFLPGGGQVSMGRDPIVRQFGQLYLIVKVKEGQGVAAVNKLRDFVIPFVERKDWAVTRTEAALAMDPVPRLGWYHAPLLVTFWIDRISPD